MLCVKRKPGTTLHITDSATGKLITIHFGENNKLAIEAASNFHIRRGELSPEQYADLAPVAEVAQTFGPSRS